MQGNSRLIKKVAEIYDWLDLQISDNGDKAGKCEACGRCCNFDTEQGFDHRLFVTPPEVMYLAAKLGAKNMRPMPTSRCPYNVDGKCSVYKYRFAGCRIFCCKGDKNFQGELSESAIKKFKVVCTDLQIPYCYSDIATALDESAGLSNRHGRSTIL